MNILTVFFVMILFLAALQVLVPLVVQLADNLILWVVRRPAARARQWRSLDPIEQNLQRASHGVAYIVFPLAALWLVGPSVVGAFLSGFTPGVRLLLIGACAVWFAVAVGRLYAGWRRIAGLRDGPLAGRAFGKLAVGAFLLYWLPHGLIASSLDPWAVHVLLLVPLWLAVTGFVRFVLLVRPAGRALPEVEGDIAASEFDWNG
jgi:hypothetical protein